MSYLFSALLIAVLTAVIGLFLYTLFIAKRVELGMPPEGRFVTIMGNRVHYIEQGSGDQTILLIHGLSGVAQHFGYSVMGQLARHYRVVGHSLGGAVSLATALRHPDKVSGLALIAPLTHLPQAPSEAFAALNIRFALLRKLVAWTLATPLSVRQRDKVLDIVFGPEAVPADFAQRGGGYLGLRPSHFVGHARVGSGTARDAATL